MDIGAESMAARPKVGKVVFIGVAGPSGSGKSTLAQQLAELLQSPLAPVPADWYNGSVPDKRWGKNWETPMAFEADRLREDLERVRHTLTSMERPPAQLDIGSGTQRAPMALDATLLAGVGGAVPVVVVEGFLLFFDRSLCDMFDMKIWVEVDSELCLQRRCQRKQRDDLAAFTARFRELVWPHFLMYRDTQLTNAGDVLRLSGTEQPEALAQKAAAYCTRRLQGHGRPDVALPLAPRQIVAAQRVVLIGIAGPSGTGKSTLATQLAAELRSPMGPVTADRYNGSVPHERFQQNWETFEAYKIAQLYDDLKSLSAALASPGPPPGSVDLGNGSRRVACKVDAELLAEAGELVPVVVDGFLLMCDSSLSDMLDVKIWLEADCDTCLQRRAQRNSRMDKAEFSVFFRELVWPHFLMYREAQLANAGSSALRLSGLEAPEVLMRQAAAHCARELGVMRAGHAA